MNISRVCFFIIIIYGLQNHNGAIQLGQNRRRFPKPTPPSTKDPPKIPGLPNMEVSSEVPSETKNTELIDHPLKANQPTRRTMIHFKSRNPSSSSGKSDNSRNPTFEFKLEPDQNISDPISSVKIKSRPKEIIKQPLNVGIVLPKSTFKRRDYLREINLGIAEVRKKIFKGDLLKNFIFGKKNVIIRYMAASSSPTTILGTLCDNFLRHNVSAILYLFNMETFGRATASVQYFFQLSSYLGIPLISWNADNSGLERDQRASSLQLQLAPSIEHQALAMLSILERYSWPKFSIVTTQIAGHNDFIQAVRDIISNKSQTGQQFILMDILTVSSPEEDMKRLASTEARIMFLYSTRTESSKVMSAAAKYGLTGRNYLWIVTQSVIQNMLEAPMKELPVGMLGVHFGTSDEDMIGEIQTAITVFGAGVRGYYEEEKDVQGALPDLMPSLSCDSGNSKWQAGANFYRYLREVKVDVEADKKKPSLEFNPDGTRKYVELKIMNLRPDDIKQKIWAEIGIWHSSTKKGLKVKDIVWPGHSHVPPNGIPEKFHLKITFMEEPPFINMASPHPETGHCTANKGVLCRIASDEMMVGVNISWAMKNSSYYRCCSGFCVDLLVKFSVDLGFSFDFVRVEDGNWGAIVNGKWTGLPGAILNGKADMIMTSIKINSQRKEVLDFSVPFLDTGITIVVTKRTGIISPTAFLEPFDTASWMLVAVVAIQVAAISIFLFEWLSPAGFNMKFRPPTGQRFSLLRTLWLVWAILFQAAVNIDVPRSVTGRVMGNVWAMFALIFLAIYTANLAAFMITREEFYDLSGIEDKRLQNPTTTKPPFRFGTTPLGHTDILIKKSFPDMWSYMKKFNKSSAIAGVKEVKKGRLDAFLYDATVLEYLTGQDDECRLMTVGSWYALTGYGVAFRRNSKYIPLFNEHIMKYRENGYLERLTRFWFTGACQPENEYGSSSEPLALEQFMSTFLLLGCGVILGTTLLTFEHLYYKYFRYYLAKWKHHDFLSLISMTLGNSLRLKDSTTSLHDIVKKLPCHNPQCDMQLWKTRHNLDLAQLRVFYLEKQLVENGVWKTPKGGKRVLYRQCNDGEILMEPLPIFSKSSDGFSDPEDEFDQQFSERRSRRPDRWTQEFDVHSRSRRSSMSVPDTLRRRDFTADYITSTELIRKPLLDKRGFDYNMDEVETVL